MLRRHLIPAAALVLAAALMVVVGCGHDAIRPAGLSSGNGNPTLEGNLGGLNAGPELPAFGDPALAASAAAEKPVADEMGEDHEGDRWAGEDSARTYAVTLLWGILASDPAVGAERADSGGVVATDWSGYLAVNRGGVLVRSTIAFEDGDHVVHPRTDRMRVDWVSHTTDGFEGLRLLIHQPMPAGETGEADSVIIVAGTHSWRFLVNDLANLDVTEDVDGLGNKFSILSFLIEPGSCTRGFTGGIWSAPANPDSMGTFQGRWVSRTGEVTGFVRGHFGVDSLGQRVLFGKWIDAAGVFQGFLRGTWVQHGREHGSHHNARMRSFGSFDADILDAGSRPIGSARGHWRSTPGGSDGVFDGKWTKGACDHS